MKATMLPFQGVGGLDRYSQGVALGCIIHAFQAHHARLASGLRHSKASLRCADHLEGLGDKRKPKAYVIT